MKLLLKISLCRRELAEALRSDPELDRALKPRCLQPDGDLYAFDKWFDAGSGVLDKVLDLASAHNERLALHRDFRFDEEALAQAERFEVKASVSVGQTAAEREQTRQASYLTPPEPGPCGFPLRRPQQIFLKKPLPVRTIAFIDQWTGEYAVSPDVAEDLSASTLSGAQLLSLWQVRPREVAPGARHLTTPHLMPCAVRDASWERTREPRRHGLLAYDAAALRDAPDFARSAEPWAAWDIPAWVVSQDVRRWFLAGTLRGWRFWPVLSTGSPLHERHSALWERVLSRTAAAGCSVHA